MLAGHGGDGVTVIPDHDPNDPNGHGPCLCGDGWRFEATDLSTGQIKAVLHPISADWEELYCQVATGSLIVATKDLAANDIWPQTTGIYISRIQPDGSRKAHFGGYVEKFSGSSGGATTIALQSIENFLNKRYVADENVGLRINKNVIVVPAVVGQPPPACSSIYQVQRPYQAGSAIAYQTVLTICGSTQCSYAKALTDVMHIPDSTGRDSSVPLYAQIEQPNSFEVTLSVNWWEFKNIGQTIRELIEGTGGLKYRLEHIYAPIGGDGWMWYTNIIYSDSIGTSRSYTLRSDYEGWQYGLEVDAQDQASRVYGLGSTLDRTGNPVENGDGTSVMFSVAYDASRTYPEFQTSQSWTDQKIPGMLNLQTQGWVQDHRDPVAIPAMTIVGLSWEESNVPPPEELLVGDIIGVEIGYGVITYRGERSTVLGIAWHLDVDQPIQRTLALQPVLRPSRSVRTQKPAVLPGLAEDPEKVIGGPVISPTADPWPTAGRVGTVTADVLNEISGMQYSAKIPGYSWVINDENQTPQVYLIDIPGTGNIVGSFTPSGPARVDPESLRLHPDGRLFLADIGDNHNTRAGGVRLYAVPEPTSVGAKGVITAQTFTLKYPFGPRNAETLLIHPTTGQYLIATKESNKTRIVSFGSATNPVTNGQLVKTLTNITMVADGTFTPNGQYILFRSADEQNTVVYRFSDWKRMGTIPTPKLFKGESITMEGKCAFLVSSEGTSSGSHENWSPVYRVLLPAEYGAPCSNPTPTTGGGSPGGGSTGGSTGATVPGQVLNLANWKLTLPLAGSEDC